MKIDTILEHGASLLCGCGCVSQNLDKETKFDLRPGQGQGQGKRSLEARADAFSRLKTHFSQKIQTEQN